MAAKRRGRFIVRKNGVFETVKADESGEARLRWICSPLEIVAQTRGYGNEGWGLLASVLDPDDVSHEVLLPYDLLAGNGEELRRRLGCYGWRSATRDAERKAVLDFILSADVAARARSVDAMGWHDVQFVLPDQTFGPSEAEERVILEGGSTMRHHCFDVAGDLESWRREVAAKAIGNSRLLFAMSAAFAGPLLHLTRSEGGGFHFRGASSSGKTTILIAAGSVWGGGPRGFIRSWRTTDNGLEALAAQHSDTLLCLDELSQASPSAAAVASYMIANGKGKQRARRNGAARPPIEWRGWFLSTGETGLESKLQEQNTRRAAGMSVRIVEIAADAGAGLGAFEALHGAPDAATLATALKDAAQAHYGLAGRAFLRRLTQEPAAIAQRVSRRIATFAAEVAPKGADGQVLRVAHRFGLAVAAGELAVGWGVLPWRTRDVDEAGARCFHEWLAERGGGAAAELTEAKRRLRRLIDVDGASRFQRWDALIDGKAIYHRAGFVRYPEPEAEDQRPVYFVNTTTWDSEILSGFDKRHLNRLLVEDGVINPDCRAGKTARSIRPPGAAGSRCYEVARNFLGPRATWDDAEDH